MRYSPHRRHSDLGRPSGTGQSLVIFERSEQLPTATGQRQADFAWSLSLAVPPFCLEPAIQPSKERLSALVVGADSEKSDR